MYKLYVTVILILTGALQGCGVSGSMSSTRDISSSGVTLALTSSDVLLQGGYLVGSINLKATDSAGGPVANYKPSITVNSTNSVPSAQRWIESVKAKLFSSRVRSSSLNYTVVPCSTSDASGLSTCSIRVPVGSAGQLNLQVSGNLTANPLSVSLNFYAAPTLTSVAPVSAQAGGASVSLTLTGSGFRSGMKVAVGGLNCGNVSVSSSTQATCSLTTDNTVGPQNVVITNPDQQTASFTGGLLLLDTVAPTISVTQSPASVVASTAATITFTVSDNIASTAQIVVVCSLDSLSVACASGSATLTSLANGLHSFIIQATDPSGNSASRTINWNVNINPPTATVDSSGLGSTPTASTATRSVTVGGAGVVYYKAVLKYQSSLSASPSCSGVSFATATSVPVSTAFSVPISQGSGTYNVCVIGGDSVGNWQSIPTASTAISVDTSIPLIVGITGNLTTPSNDTSARSLTINGNNVTAYKAVTVKNQADCSTVNFSSVVEVPTAQPYSLSFSGDGSYLVCAIGRNTAYVWQSSVTSSSVLTIKTTAPTIAPISLGASPSNSTSARAILLSGSGVVSYKAISYSSGSCNLSSLNAAATASVAAPFTLNIGSDGTYYVCAIGLDAAGNWQSTPTVSSALVIDTLPPSVTIASPAANTPAQTTITIAGACETGASVIVSGTGVQSPQTAACMNSTYSQAVTFTSGDGAKQVVVTQTDAAGNTGNATSSFVKDTTAPALTIASPANGSSANGTVTISGACETGLTINLTGTGLSNSSTASCANSSYSTSVTLSFGDGAKSISVAQTDVAGNTTTVNLSITMDSVVPTATLATTASTPTNLSVIPMTITFSKPVTGLTLSKLQVTNGSAGALSGSGTAYTFNVSPTAAGTVSVSVGQGAAQDQAGNPNSVSNTVAIVYDPNPASVTISTTAPNTTNLTSIPVNVVFSKSVTGFVVGKINVTNGTVSGLSGSGANYTFNIAPVSAGPVSAQIAAAAAQDSAGNASLASNQITLTFDNVAPTVTLSSTATNPTNITPIPVTITFSKAVTGLSLSGFTVTNGTVSGLAGSGTSYSVNLTPSSNGAVSLSINAGVAQDSAGNSNSISNTYTNTFNNTHPSVVLASSAGSNTNLSSIPVTATFSASVTGFSSSSLTLVNATASGFSGSGASYSFNLIPSGPGVVSVSIAAGVAQDSAANGNLASNNLSINYDNTQPSVTLSSSVGASTGSTNVSPIPVTVTFSKSVSGFSLAGLNLTNATAGNLSGSGATYTFNLVPSAQGSVSVSVSAASAHDVFGNANSASSALSRIYDTTSPTVTLTSSSPNPTNSSPIAVTVTFSKPVTGFSLAGISATNGTVSGLTGSGTSYGFNVTPSSQGSVGVSVQAGAAVDNAGNSNLASTALTRTYDATQPTVTLSSTSSSPTSAQPFAMNVSFSKSVTGFALGNVTVTNGTASALSGSGSSYSFTVTPTTTSNWNGTVTTKVNAGAALDSAGNSSLASNSVAIAYDSVPPVLTLTSPASGAYANVGNVAAFSISGTCSASAPATISSVSVSIGSINATPTCNSGVFSTTLNLTTLTDGALTLNLNGSDSLGNPSATTSISLTKNTVIPTVTLTNAPTSPSNETVLDVISGGAGVTSYQFKVGATASTDCSSSSGYSASIAVANAITSDISAFADGSMKICALGTNVAGNTQNLASATSYTWIKQTTVNPGFSNLGTSPPSPSTNATFSLTGSVEANSALSIYSQANCAGAVIATGTANGAGTFSVTAPTLTANGSYVANTYSILATDTAGNSICSSSIPYIYDPGPAVTISLPTAGAYDNASMITSQTFLMMGTCSSFATTNVTLAFSDGTHTVNSTTPCASGVWSTTGIDISTLTDGNVTLTAGLTDQFGFSATPTSVTFVKVATAPTLTISHPASSEIVPGTSSFNIQWSSTNSYYGTAPISLQYTTDGASWTSIATNVANTGVYPWSAPSANSAAAKVKITATDLAGNSASVLSAAFIIDSSAPSVSNVSVSNAGQTLLKGGGTASISWSASSLASAPFTISIAYSCDAGANQGTLASGIANSPPYVWTVPATFSSDACVVTVTALDTTLNLSSAAQSPQFAIDSVVPTLTLSSPQPGQIIPGYTASGSLAIGWSITYAGTHLGTNPYSIWISANNSTWTQIASNISSSTNSYTWQPTAIYTDGNYYIKVTATDLAGNAGSASTTFTINSSAPTLTITTPASTNFSSNSASVTFGGACTTTDGNVSIAITNLGSTINQSTACTSGAWSWTYSPGSDGSYAFAFSQTNGSLTTTQNATWFKDTGTPQVSGFQIAGGAPNTVSSAVNVSVTVSDNNPNGLSVLFTPANTAGTCLTPSQNANWLAKTATNSYPTLLTSGNGAKKLCAWAKNAAGTISVMSNSGSGTSGTDVASINLNDGPAPLIASFNVTSPAGGTIYSAQNAPMQISWTVYYNYGSYVQPLASTPITLEYTLDNVTWTTLPTSGITFSTGSANGNGNGYGMVWSGTYSGIGAVAASPTYFRLRMSVTDIYGNVSQRVLSQPQNTGPWQVYAGSNDRGAGGPPNTLALNFGAMSNFNSFAYDPIRGDLYVLDSSYSIIKISATTGLTSYFIKNGTDNLSFTGGSLPASPALALTYSGLLFDSNGLMYIKSSNSFSAGARIYQINLVTNTSQIYIGANSSGTPGTVAGTSGTPNPTATPATIFVGGGQMAFDANNNLYFFSTCGGTSTSNYSPVASQIWMATQSTSGATAGQASGVSLIAGNCTIGTPTTGGSTATSQPLSATGDLRGLSLAPYVSGSSSGLYFRSYNFVGKIVNGKLYAVNTPIGGSASYGQIAVSSVNQTMLMSDYYWATLYSCTLPTGASLANDNGETCTSLTNVAVASGTTNCASDGQGATSSSTTNTACIYPNAEVGFTPQGLYIFVDNAISNTTSSGRIRTYNPTGSPHSINTLAGALPFYGDGLSPTVIRGNISSIYFQPSTAINAAAFPQGLYFTSVDGPVFGSINVGGSGATKVLWGSQVPKPAFASGTAVSTSVSMGQPPAYRTAVPMTFDSTGLPWLAVGGRLIELDANSKMQIMASNTTYASWDLVPTGTYSSQIPGTTSSDGGFQNLTAQGQRFYLLGSSQGSGISGTSSIPAMLRAWDFTTPASPTVTQIAGNNGTTMGAQVTTAGNITNVGISSNCLYYGTQCAIQADASSGKLYYADGGQLRVIANASAPTNTTLLNVGNFPGGIANFTISPDGSRVFIVAAAASGSLLAGNLYCYSLTPSAVQNWCPDVSTMSAGTAPTLGPGTYMNTISKSPNQFAWMDSYTLFIVDGVGEILQYSLPPVVTITGPSTGTSYESTITLAGTCKSGVTVNFSGSGLSASTPSKTAACTNGAFSQAVVFTSGIGSKQITVSQTDLYGQSSSATQTFTANINGLVPQFSGPVTGTYGNGGLRITGTCLAGATVVISGDVSSVSPSSSFTCSGGTFSVQVTFSSGNGTKTIVITQTDPSGNSASTSRTYYNDTTATPNISAYSWKTLKVGGGGWICGLDMAADGTFVARADTYGAYLWNGSSWSQLINANSISVAAVSAYNPPLAAAADGVYEIRIAPSNTSHFYMMDLGLVFSSTNKGTTWTKTSFAQSTVHGNDTWHWWGQKMAIDPSNENVVYAGTQAGTTGVNSGLWYTADGGSNWTQVPVGAIAAPVAPSGYSNPGFTGIAFDPNSGTTGGLTNTIYVASNGNGVYVSRNAGATWTLTPAGSGVGPVYVSHGKVAGDGSYYVAGGDSSSTMNLQIWKFNPGSSTWTKLSPGSDSSTSTNTNPGAGIWASVVVDPNNAQHIIAVEMDGAINVSNNGGTSWNGYVSTGHYTLSATDVPWLAQVPPYYFTTSDMLLDTQTANRLWVGQGVGVWYANVNSTASSSTNITWRSQTAGIEQLESNFAISPPGGTVQVGVWDQGIFNIANPNAYPSTKSIATSPSHPIAGGWAGDYAKTSPNVLFGLVDACTYNYTTCTGANNELSAFSTNGGSSWSSFGTFPTSNTIGGMLAASTSTDLVLIPANENGAAKSTVPWYSTDRGQTWAQISTTNTPTTAPTGWAAGFANARSIVTADGLIPDVFYLYNYSSAGSGGGVYKFTINTTSGNTWQQQYSGPLDNVTQYDGSLQATPGLAGDLFFSETLQSTLANNGMFWHSTDGGQTWSAVANVSAVRAFGFGRSQTTSTSSNSQAPYPSVYIVGWVNGTYGIYRSDDGTQTWTKIGTYPNGQLDAVKFITGDMNTYGVAYVGFWGSGFAYFGP